MMEKYKYIFGLCLFLILLMLTFFLGRSSKDCNDLVQTILKRDTMVLVKQSDPIVIEKAKTKLVYKNDTVILTKPFVALIDTIIKTDTVFASYDFPDNNFNLLIKRKPDSTIVQTITITKEVMKERSWWETPAYVLGGTVVGFVIGKTFK